MKKRIRFSWGQILDTPVVWKVNPTPFAVIEGRLFSPFRFASQESPARYQRLPAPH